ncbi:hypothetical protein CHS0354_000738 [Potamilus streckersoni]|uniref:UvrD-like helicase C-terminal domain-containing protein n=1 Tax=Potamilus streckersoni TaxID=2493646 RepID=A0AAE0W971_9BIVA|nr:hypothetical protein CHS0354_000738 [Potamilus streckersoni]
MELTTEQQQIIGSTGNIKINAVAGSGKTSTLIEYARTRPYGSKILYLAFNKSVKTDAVKKFAAHGLTRVSVETAHSLAYKRIVFKHGYSIKTQGYKTNDIVDILKLQSVGGKYSEFILANHISKLMSRFCNSDKRRVQEVSYLDEHTDPNVIKFVSTHYDVIVNQTRSLLGKMDKGQDASMAMLDVFKKQQAVKVIVGDTHQQIYGWRYAVNSLEIMDFRPFQLTSSFRFGQDIANLACQILALKRYVNYERGVKITGLGRKSSVITHAVIARTNLGLLLKVIDNVIVKQNAKHIYFEGNIQSYTYTEDGASLYDVLNLFKRRKHMIKDKLIRSMYDIGDLEYYIEMSGDVELGMMVELVKKYEDELPNIIKKIKEYHIGLEDKERADVVFSTVHRCKGMEYDSIELANDFINEEKLKRLENEKELTAIDEAKVVEEINLLYVAVTRACCKIAIPESLVPEKSTPSKNITLLKTETKISRLTENVELKISSKPTPELQKQTDLDRNGYKPWTSELDRALRIMHCNGVSVEALASHFARTKGAIRSRIKKLGLDSAEI